MAFKFRQVESPVHLTLTQAMRYYRRLCRVPCPQTVQLNRLSGLQLLYDAIEQTEQIRSIMHEVAEYGTLTVSAYAGLVDISVAHASEAFRYVWELDMEVIVGMPAERLFLERVSEKIAEGGREYVYRLSAMGRLVMEDPEVSDADAQKTHQSTYDTLPGLLETSGAWPSPVRPVPR